MSIYFSVIKGKGRDIRTIGDELTEDDVRKILLRSDDESLFEVTEWDDDYSDPDGLDLLEEVLNGEEWLVKYP